MLGNCMDWRKPKSQRNAGNFGTSQVRVSPTSVAAVLCRNADMWRVAAIAGVWGADGQRRGATIVSKGSEVSNRSGSCGCWGVQG